jgi:hypothetical protein
MLAAAISGQGEVQPVAYQPIDPQAAAAAADVVAPLAQVEHDQVTLAIKARITTEKKYIAALQRAKALGINPSRFQAKTAAMGGPYEAADSAEAAADMAADAQFRALFQTWKKLDTLQDGLISIPSVQPVSNLKFTSNFGIRSDPFFFDLLGFRGSLGLGPNTNTLCDAHPSDFFAGLNTLAIILEVPDAALGRHIGVWATTEQLVNGSWEGRDQMGRPAINTVFNHTAADKEEFNVTPPNLQATVDSGKFRTNVHDTLIALSAGDTEGSYADAEASALASVLIPDVLTYDTSTHAVGPLNGRRLTDDVIDTELNITTGGDPLGLFPERDATGAIPSDCVGRHMDYQSSWPYLGIPH